MAVLKGGLLLIKEDAIGAIDSSNTTFATSFHYIPGTLRVLLNGLEQGAPADYVELTSNSFEFVEPPIGGVDPDKVSVIYQRA
jgi:hypothetical protein